MPSNNDAYYKRLFYTLLIIIAIGALILLVITTARILFLVFIAILIGVALRNGGRLLAAVTPFKKNWSVMIVATLAVLVTAGMFWFLAPNLADRADNFLQRMNESATQLEEQFRQTELGDEILHQISLNNSQNLFRMLPDPFNTLSSVFSGVVTPLFTIIVLYIIGIMFAIDPFIYTKIVVLAIPDEGRPKAQETFDQLSHALGWWLVARTTSLVVIGLLTYIGLRLLGMPLALSLALIAGTLSFIPNIGPALSIIPAALVAASVSWPMVLYVIILYLGLQTLESYLITPYVERRTVSLPPALTISVQLILTSLVGVIGALVAAPLIVTAMILIKTLYLPYILKEPETAIDYHIGPESNT